MSRSDAERLRDILAAIEAIDRAEVVGQHYADAPDVAEVALAAIRHRVFTIGEAVKALSAELIGRRPDVPWSDIARMRDLIGHHYYKLDAQIVRATIGEPLALLRTACETIAVELDDEA